MYIITVLVHEYAHFLEAQRVGLKLKSTYLTPFGARIEGEIYSLPPKDELKVIFVGPLVNLAIATIITAIWWLYPSSYPYTEILRHANLSIAIINLIPAYPLDGGRISYILLRYKFTKKFTEKIMFVLGILSTICFLIIFVFLLPNVNITLLLMAIFIFDGTVRFRKFEKIKIKSLSMIENENNREMEIKKIKMKCGAKLLDMAKKLDGKYFYEFELTDQKNRKIIVNQTKLKKQLLKKDITLEAFNVFYCNY